MDENLEAGRLLDVPPQSATHRRAVVLAREPRPGEADAPAAPPCAWVRTPYEAAAEVLSAPPAVLAVDLALLSPRHARLVAMARERGVTVLGFGRLPAGMDTDLLSGVQLVAPGSLLAEIARLLAEEPGPGAPPAGQAEPAPPPRQPAEPTRPEETADARPAGEAPAASSPPQDEPKPQADTTDLESIAREIEQQTPAEDVASPPPPPGGPPAAEQRPTPPPEGDRPAPDLPPSPRALLTPEEIAALLED